jgi:ech hydrogenase subunit C
MAEKENSSSVMTENKSAGISQIVKQRLAKVQFVKDMIAKARIKSPWLLHFDCGSCNGCDIETLACLTPVYDVERFGIINIGNPKQADILLVTGTVNYRNAKVLKTLYEQMPEPKVVVAIGSCALSGGIFKECQNVLGGVDKVIPVDVYVPGCAAKPEAIIDGVVLGLQKFMEKAKVASAEETTGEIQEKAV